MNRNSAAIDRTAPHDADEHPIAVARAALHRDRELFDDPWFIDEDDQEQRRAAEPYLSRLGG